MSTTVVTTVPREDHGSNLSHADRAALSISSIPTTISYLAYDPKHAHEKPYILTYDSNSDFPKTNRVNDPRPVYMTDFRGLEGPTNFETYGFAVDKLSSTLRTEEFDDPGKVEKTFYQEAIQALHRFFPQALEVKILEHQIRERDPNFPVATGQPYSNPLPTTIAHIDYTLDSAQKSSRAAFKQASEKYRRLLTVNLWKRLQGPGNDWPLGLCDRRTVDYSKQMTAQDVVHADRFNENARLYYSPNHRWYYFNDLEADEVIYFRQTDSDLEWGGGVPHTGFFNPRSAKDAPPRVSIELRAFIYFD